MSDIVGYTGDAEVDELVKAKALLEKYTEPGWLLNLTEFRVAAGMIAQNLVLGVLQGEYGDPKSPKEAIDMAGKVLDLTAKREMSELGDELAKVESVADRKALFAEFKELARRAQDSE